MHVERDVHEILSDGFADYIALFIRRVLQKLLTQIIAERIYDTVRWA